MGRNHNPVRIIEIRNGISADGGGIEIHVRMDGVDPVKVLEITLKLLNAVIKKDDGEFQKSYG